MNVARFGIRELGSFSDLHRENSELNGANAAIKLNIFPVAGEEGSSSLFY